MAQFFVGQNVVRARKYPPHEVVKKGSGPITTSVPLGTVGRITELRTIYKAGTLVRFPSGSIVRLSCDINVVVEWNIADEPQRVGNTIELEPLKDIGNGLSFEETMDKIKSGELAAHE